MTITRIIVSLALAFALFTGSEGYGSRAADLLGQVNAALTLGQR